MPTLDEALAQLAAISPREFVRARAGLAAQLKKAGASSAAATVKALKRPPLPVWAVNRLAYDQDATIAELIESADRVKAAQLGRGGSGASLTAATTRQRERLTKLLHRAGALLHDAGVKSSPALMRRIETTLMAAASDAKSQNALRQGRLERELAPLGFDVFGGAVPARLTRERSRGQPAAAAARRQATPPPAPHLAIVKIGATRAESQNSADRSTARADEVEAARRKREEALREVERLRAALQAAAEAVSQAREAMKRAAKELRDAKRTETAARNTVAAAVKQTRTGRHRSR